MSGRKAGGKQSGKPSSGKMSSKPSGGKLASGTVATGAKPPGGKLASGKPTTPGVQYKWNKQGRFRRVVKEATVKRPCPGCGTFHGDNSGVELRIEPKDPRFCKFIWKMPPPPSVVISKNRARISSGKRNGVRKPRKRDKNGLMRQPNDWIISRIDTMYRNCAVCFKPLHMLARKIGNRPNRLVLFTREESTRVLYTLWFLQLKVRQMYGITIPSDVVQIITFHAFTRNVIDSQYLQRDQFHSPCGCKYHIRCYSEYTADKSTCGSHGKAFP